MSSFNGPQRSRHTYGLLANVTSVELESIRVGIKRKNITSNQPPGPMERSIDDPKSLVPLVHCRKDHAPRFKSIFDREDIIVNREERLVLIDANMYDAPRSSPTSQSELKRRSRSRSKSTNRRSRDESSKERNADRNKRARERSRSPDRHRRSTDRYRSPEYSQRSTDRGRSLERSRRSTDRDRSLDHNRRSREKEIERRRSNERERDRSKRYSRERDKTYEKYPDSRRSHSRERESYRSERKKSLTPLRPGEYRKNHPDLKKRSRSREKYEYARSRSRRSRSLSRTRPSTSRKRSLSPRKSSSRSPKRSKTKHHDYYDKRSSRSPQPSGFRDKKRYGRSPDYERDRRYKSERGRSRSPRHKEAVPYRDPTMDYGYYEGIPDFWMHPGIIRPPGYPIQRFYPPAFYPRVMPGGPVIFPPRHPMMPPIMRQKLPIYNNRPRPTVTHTSDKSTPTEKTDQNADEKVFSIEEVTANETEDKDK